MDLSILKSALDLNTKIFIEKPVTSKSDNLKDIKYKKNIQVGLNRRFYPNFQYFKSKINKNNFYTGSVFIPEPIDIKNFTKNNHKKRIVNNAIHVFDLLIYLFGNLKLKNIEYIYKQKNKLSVLSFHLYNSKCHIQVQSAANQSLNTQMNFFDGKNTYSFLPLEELKVYKGFNVSESNKINTYKPQQIYSLNAYDRFYKPGFNKQAAVFKKIVAGKVQEKPELKDIVNSLNLIEKIYEQI
jgi:predicted dehydrogenase